MCFLDYVRQLRMFGRPRQNINIISTKIFQPIKLFTWGIFVIGSLGLILASQRIVDADVENQKDA